MKKESTEAHLVTNRVTSRDIAERLGLHFTTVAEALRGSPRIKASTRERVEKTARQMGYFPDPVLNALNAYRHQKNSAIYQGTITWLNHYTQKAYFEQSEHGYHYDCYIGACQRAKKIGYKIESLWLGEPGMSMGRVADILLSRNPAGIIIPPQPEKADTLKLPWNRFSAVKIGYSAQDTQLPSVGPNQFNNTQRAYEYALNAGFKRIGLAGLKWIDDRVARAYSGGFFCARHRFGNHLTSIPLFLDESDNGEPPAFFNWLNYHQPDIILTFPGCFYFNQLKKANFSVPDMLSVISLSRPSASSKLTGINENGHTIGRTTVDILVGMICQFARGHINHERDTLISGRWINGTSVKPLNKQQNK